MQPKRFGSKRRVYLPLSQNTLWGLKIRSASRSNGTSQHFKSKETLSSLLQTKQECRVRRLTRCFRAPYHGKGVWDGIAAVVKQHLRRRLIADETTKVTSYMDLIVLLREVLCKKTNRLVIRAFDMMPLPKNAIKRRRGRIPTIQMHEDPTTGKKQGVRTLFSFAAGANDELHARPLSCWCHQCLEGTSTACGFSNWDKQSMSVSSTT